jgi:hypothetical protein
LCQTRKTPTLDERGILKHMQGREFLLDYILDPKCECMVNAFLLL